MIKAKKDWQVRWRYAAMWC